MAAVEDVRRWREYGARCLFLAQALAAIPVSKGGRGKKLDPGVPSSEVRTARIAKYMKEARWAYTTAARVARVSRERVSLRVPVEPWTAMQILAPMMA